MEIRILQQLEGAKQARGLAVIIDVFRAFSVECFLKNLGVGRIITVGGVQECLDLKAKNPDFILIGERKGIKCEGFDAGNSPSQIMTLASDGFDFRGKTVVHTTSAGVQGIVTASGADEIITGSLVNAKAVASYIKQKNPEVVSLVCMGLGGETPTEEDTLCAQYIKALLEGNENFAIHDQIASLRYTSGSKFFDMDKSKVFPCADFFMCLVPNVFDFVLRVNRSGQPFEIEL